MRGITIWLLIALMTTACKFESRRVIGSDPLQSGTESSERAPDSNPDTGSAPDTPEEEEEIGEEENVDDPIVEIPIEDDPVEEDPVVEDPVVDDPVIDNPIPETGEVDDVRIFIFGHSLIVHEYTPEPTEEKKVPHWLHVLANSDRKSFQVDGKYGFLPQHADFSNIFPQWGFQQARSIWTNESNPFSSVDYTHIMITPANFIQYQSPAANYYNSNQSPLDATLRIYDQTQVTHPGIAFYIYENWPDMGGYGDFPNSVNIAAYHNTTVSGAFHQWFLDYHDRLLAARPGADIRMIPVGPIISRLLRDTVLSQIPLTSLYEDDAPHGQPSLYFLASLVTYSALYQKPVPAGFSIPNSVHPIIRSNYSMIRSFIWSELQAFQNPRGESRVF